MANVLLLAAMALLVAAGFLLAFAVAGLLVAVGVGCAVLGPELFVLSLAASGDRAVEDRS